MNRAIVALLALLSVSPAFAGSAASSTEGAALGAGGPPPATPPVPRAAPPVAPALHDAAPSLERAVHAEMTRAIDGLRIADAEAPYLLLYTVLDAREAVASAENGGLLLAAAEPIRSLRAEVRVGDYALDSSNFYSFGEGDGIIGRTLPDTDDVLALRREIWLATDQAYKHAVEQYSRKIAGRRGDARPRPPDFSAVPAIRAPVAAAPADDVDGEALAALVTRLSTVASEDPALELGQAVARDLQGRRLVYTSEGMNRWVPVGATVVRVEATLRLPDGSVCADSRAWVARRPSLLPPAAQMEEEVREMVRWLSALREAPVEEDYLGPVIFEGRAATELFSQLLHPEIVGTPPEEEDTDSLFEPLRLPQARIGRRLLPEGWSVVDDAPGRPDAAGSYVADQEGIDPTRVELVEDGVLRGVLLSRIPRMDRVGTTGHGRSDNGAARRGAAPAVVVVEPPRTASAARMERRALRLAAQTGRDYALVVRHLTPPALAETSFTSSGEGPPPGLTPPYEVYRLYRDGRRVPVRNVNFRGVDRRVLRDVVLAGEGVGAVDLLDGTGPGRFHVGPTGGIPMTWEVPSVLIAEVELGGSGGGEARVLTPPPRAAASPPTAAEPASRP
jgi:hypothetical protein